MKTPLYVLDEYNGTKTELYKKNAKSQGLVPAHFALISIVVRVQKAGEPENDGGFLKMIVIAAVRVAS